MTIRLTASVPGLLSFLFVSAHLHNCEQETGEKGGGKRKRTTEVETENQRKTGERD